MGYRPKQNFLPISPYRQGLSVPHRSLTVEKQKTNYQEPKSAYN